MLKDVVLLTCVNFHDLLVIPRDDQRISYVLLEFFLYIFFPIFFSFKYCNYNPTG